MEELQCKGTPAQVARRVLAVLTEDPDLLWITNADGEVWTEARIDALDFWGRNRVILDSQDFVSIMILRGEWPVIGYIIAERVLDRVLVTADNTWRSTEVDDMHNTRHSLSEDFAALAPIWERVKVELIRLGLVIEVEPAQEDPQRKGGRPRNVDDDWAWQQVNVLSCDSRVVYLEWIERIKAKKRKLADPHDSFEKAIKPSRGKKREETE